MITITIQIIEDVEGIKVTGHGVGLRPTKLEVATADKIQAMLNDTNPEGTEKDPNPKSLRIVKDRS